MQYSDIPFVKNQRRYGARLGLFKGRNWIHKTLFDRIWRTAATVIASHSLTDEIDTETLYDNSERWSNLRAGIRHAYGRAVMFLIQHGMLALYVVNEGKGGKRIFRRIN